MSYSDRSVIVGTEQSGNLMKDVVKYSTVQYRKVQYSTVQYGTVPYKCSANAFMCSINIGVNIQTSP